MEWNWLFALEFLLVIQPDSQLGPNRQWVLCQNFICQHIGKHRCQNGRQLRSHILEFQEIIRRPLQRLVNNRFRTDERTEKTRRNVRDGLCAAGFGSFTCHGGRGPDADWSFVWRATISKAAHEDGDISALAAAIGMQLVENDKVQTGCVLYDLGVETVLPRE